MTEDHLGGSDGYCHIDEATFDFLVDRYKVKTMLDIGCGGGEMTQHARDNGVEAVGIDGDSDALPFDDDFILHDFTKGECPMKQEFDLGWSVEFVEHVEEKYIPNFMVSFNKCKTVFMTYAPPNRRGTHHVNRQWESYWIDIFEEYGFTYDKEATEQMRFISTMKSNFAKCSGLIFTKVEKVLPKEKAVTILAFGPSKDTCQDPIIGEAWSMNGCWQVFDSKVMSMVTCIYDMHQLSKRDKEVYHGKNYFQGLDDRGREGKRIVLLQKSDLITNSETYPLVNIERHFGCRFWSQTPVYMIARAIYEGYNHIRFIGVDNNDWKHVRGREAMAFFMGFGMARGVKFTGAITMIDRHHKRYGYDYGPEWCDYQQKLLWDAFPIEIKFKKDFVPCPSEMGKPIIE